MKPTILKTKGGKEGQVLMPETLEELVATLGAKRLFKAGLQCYRIRCMRQIRRGSKPRDRVVKIKLSQLSEAQKAVLGSLIPEEA